MNKTQGRVGSAEEIPLNFLKPDQTGTLKAWLMFLPGQHPLWSHYELGVIHLRPIEGVRPAYKYVADAGHEIMLCALDPQQKPNTADINTLYPLTPINYTVQFAGLTDEQAVEVGQIVCTSFIEGGLIAEPQGIVGARELFYTKVERYVRDYLPHGRVYWQR